MVAGRRFRTTSRWPRTMLPAVRGKRRRVAKETKQAMKMAIPPMRGMGLVWNLRIWSGSSTKPQRIARSRHSGVRTNATQKDETASMSREYTADRAEGRIQEAKRQKLQAA